MTVNQRDLTASHLGDHCSIDVMRKVRGPVILLVALRIVSIAMIALRAHNTRLWVKSIDCEEDHPHVVARTNFTLCADPKPSGTYRHCAGMTTTTAPFRSSRVTGPCITCKHSSKTTEFELLLRVVPFQQFVCLRSLLKYYLCLIRVHYRICLRRRDLVKQTS